MFNLKINFLSLCGYPPFYGESDFDIAASIVSQDEVEMPEEEWAHVSEEGKNQSFRKFFLFMLIGSLRGGRDQMMNGRWRVEPKLIKYDIYEPPFSQVFAARSAEKNFFN